ncbi:unnamed protein product [Coffea canephora]|uniref:Uncharacterized protein n=1 Tax=Coffea canephora TaxID=49390 RepID=A0A068UVN1_COFCA|nr:unnamed protein product [Coffea canephora]
MAAKSSQESLLVVAFVIFAILVSSTIPSHAAGSSGLTHREIMQKPSCPPCICCHKELPPPDCCYCACYVTESGNEAP